MKNVTLSAEEFLIEKARKAAQARHTTLNQAFRDWLASYANAGSDPVKEYEVLKKSLSYVRAGRKFTREEMNER